MKMSGYQLVMSAMFKGQKGDRPPSGTPTSIACHDLMDATGISFPEAHLNAEAMAELALGGHEIIGFDTVMPEYSVDQEVAALGADVDWGDRNMMPDTKSFLYENFEDIAVPEDFLEKPSMRVLFDALAILRRHVGGSAAIIAQPGCSRVARRGRQGRRADRPLAGRHRSGARGPGDVALDARRAGA